MPLMRRSVRAAVSCAFAAAAVVSLGASSSAQTSIPDTSPTPQLSVAEPPPKPKARALTADEIRSKGLAQYIDMSRQKEIAPTLIDGSQGKFAASVPTPVKKPAKASSRTYTSGCWYLETQSGSATYPGVAYHTWCGDGVQITYTSASCTGSTSGPTRRYEGCQNIQNYGLGWNVWDVTDKWHFCTAYNSYTGVCSARIHPWQKNRYDANGQVWLLGWGN